MNNNKDIMVWGGTTMFIETSIGIFLITFLALFFLIGEILVKLRGIGAILGIGFTAYYFSSFVSSYDLMWLGGLFAVGILMIILDGKVINDGIIGLIGVVIVLTTVAIAAPDWVLAIYSMVGVVLGTISSLSLLKVLPKRNMWDKVALLDRMTSEQGYNSLNENYQSLLNKEGKTSTVLRPSGSITIDEIEYSAISQGKWIEKDMPIKVVQVDGTKIVVEEIESTP